MWKIKHMIESECVCVSCHLFWLLCLLIRRLRLWTWSFQVPHCARVNDDWPESSLPQVTLLWILNTGQKPHHQDARMTAGFQPPSPFMTATVQTCSPGRPPSSSHRSAARTVAGGDDSSDGSSAHPEHTSSCLQRNKWLLKEGRSDRLRLYNKESNIFVSCILYMQVCLFGRQTFLPSFI